MKAPSYDRTKLPKWAQSEFERLEADLAHAHRQMREMLGESNEPTEVYIWKGLDMIPLPAHTQIRFGNERKHFDVSIRDGGLRIYGSTTIAVHPQSANSLDIRLRN